MIYFILLYFSIIIFYSFVIVPFNQVHITELISSGYITFSRNYKYHLSVITFKDMKVIKYRVDIKFFCFCRWLFNWPISVESIRIRHNNSIQDISQRLGSTGFRVYLKHKTKLLNYF